MLNGGDERMAMAFIRMQILVNEKLRQLKYRYMMRHVGMLDRNQMAA